MYIYSLLYAITSRGENIILAQYIFIAVYQIQLWLVLRLYSKSRRLPPYVIALSVFTSYRIHSIYSLRLFNDPIAIVFFYAALNLFVDQKWILGSILFSLGVGVKMNILLFAPAVLLMFITSLGYLETIKQLAVCGVVQIIIGLPFLITHPISYLKGSFDFGRVFEHTWTINYRFLERKIFESSSFHKFLLILHLSLLLLVAKPCFIFLKNYARLRVLQEQFQPQITAANVAEDANRQRFLQKSKRCKPKVLESETEMTEEQRQFVKSFEKGLQQQFGNNSKSEAVNQAPLKGQPTETKKIEVHFDQCIQLLLLPLFLVNFIGVVCARSLHYQFYVWYFHSLPYLSWFTDYHTSFKILILFLIEFCWNQYPSTDFSSILLHVCHLVLLFGVVKKMYRETRLAREATCEKEK